MPLDARKTQHLLQVVSRSFTGRQRTFVLVYQTGGNYSYSSVQAILRLVSAQEMQVPPTSSSSRLRNRDAILIAAPTISFTGVVYVADTTDATATGVAVAPKYEIIEALPIGMAPGGSRQRLLLRRLR